MKRKLDKEHIDSIQALRDQFNETAVFLGNISIEKHLAVQQVSQLESREQELIARFEQLRQKEQDLLEKLKERYGEGEINIAEGTFTPAQ
jgi:uncharacterized iron-regulated protein